ncbi:MAG: hypothetical protein JRI23_04465 [Deltaproteobacteria bacterium]|jgi:hypothetical protein|nr:hypothetical protein [Deltaproteobacteria bacterium]MBW2530797.1 hypothetical protein [Deltaproteobacteria bacterium]
MPKLQLTVDDETAARLAAEAERQHMSVSAYLTDLVQHAMPGALPDEQVDGVLGSVRKLGVVQPDDLAGDVDDEP